MNTNSGLSEDYIYGLNNQLLTATVAHGTYAKAATKASMEHRLAKLHHEDLKGYCGQVSDTYIMISNVYNYLDTLVTHAGNIGKNLSLSHGSVTIITQYLKCLCAETEELRMTVRTLIESVEGVGSEVLNAGDATLLKCLRDLEAEVSKAIIAICTAIDVMIILFRCLMELTYRIGSNATTVATGLVNDLLEMRAVLCCEYSAGISAGLDPCPGDALTDAAAIELAKCCPDGVDIDPRECELTKPAICEGGFASDFFSIRITEALENARLLAEHKKCTWDFYAKKSAGARAKMEAIKKALEAATTAKALCK